jgi:predicted O-linked N-acetylglucosamine transferase (SPINDLY family)
MHPHMAMLATRRMAPIQITGWGVPQTSGISTIDAYVSGDQVEPPYAEDHYSETLIRLPGLPCCYLSEWIKVEELPREWFLLPSEQPLFGCLQPFEKIHPDFDAVLEQLALAVPEAWFVFVESTTTLLTEIFLNRLAQSAPTARQRIILLGRLERNEFLALSACLDLILDPFHFGSGITLFETIHSGTPIVTLEGDFLRSRFVAGAYRLMGVGHPPVAQSAEEYVKIASRLMQDAEARMKLREEIRHKAKTHLYDRLDYVRGFEDFALDAIRRGGVSPDGQWQPQST